MKNKKTFLLVLGLMVLLVSTLFRTTAAAGTCDIWHHTDNRPGTFFSVSTSDPVKIEFNTNQSLESIYSYDWGVGVIEEYFQTDNSTISVVDGSLPPGINLISHSVTPPTAPISNNGLSIDGQDLINYYWTHNNTYPAVTRFSWSGRATQTGDYTATLKAQTSNCPAQTRTFSFKVTSTSLATPPAIKYPPAPTTDTAPKSDNGKISFAKTLFDNDYVPSGAQRLIDVKAWGKNGDKFIFSGEYGGSLQGLALNTQGNAGGGGLWTFPEDGSQMSERQRALDAGAGSNSIFQHGHIHTDGTIKLEWGSGGFVLNNQSWASCIANCQDNQIFTTGPGANRTVFYKEGADGLPYIAGKSPGTGEDSDAAISVALKGTAISDQAHKLFSLPGWQEIAGVDPTLPGFISFGDRVIGYGGKVYSMNFSGDSKYEMTILDSGYKSFTYNWDLSTSSRRLAIWEGNMDLDAKPGKIKIYSLGANGLVLNSTQNAPQVPTVYGIGIGQTATTYTPMEFGIWGNTIVAGQRDAAIPNSTSTLTVWQNGQKIDTVKVPAGLPQQFAVSRGGYVAIIMNTAYARDDDFNPLSRGIVAFLYKLNVAKTVSTPITPSPVIPPFVPPPSSGSCTATLTFTPTSVVSGGPVTESWKIEGADVGQTFTDCGQGEVAISAGPLSKVINPTKTLTCRVYGKIDGKEMCTSPKVTVIVAATQAQADTPNATITIINNPVTTPRTTPANTPIPPAQNNLGNTSTSLSTSTSYNLGTTTLRQGSIGPAVVELQRFLNDTLNAGLVVDGTMNPITVATLKTWQSANGLTADGVVGTKTKSLMNTPASNPTTSSKPASYNFGTNTLRRGSTGPAVKELQRFLNDTLNLGLVLDGKLGPKTIAVIKTWQANHGLVADGLVGPKTKKAMLASY